jgi:murein L,D-transpeptidase YcbB/YkuD
VERFQTRHGLVSDGVLGRATVRALRVPLSWRVRQIQLALERLRWLPDIESRRLIAINIPMFRLWAWDAIRPGGAPRLAMDVIVGRALDTRTPVFAGELRTLIFRPYWNVPRSILRQEMLSRIAEDPDYLGREGLEIVRDPGGDALPFAATPETLAALEAGALRVRQRPGPANALGLIKFEFPNDSAVYLHGTPAQDLFARSRRDFSHGCVRVAEPAALAEWVLQEHPGWTRDRILATMTGQRTIRIDVPHPVQVILFYTTAAVMPDDGTIRFAEDIYGHDARLDRALVARRGGVVPSRSLLRSPRSHTAGVDVHEVGRGIVPDTAATAAQRVLVQPSQRHVAESNIDRLPLHVQAAGGNTLAVMTQHQVGRR